MPRRTWDSGAENLEVNLAPVPNRLPFARLAMAVPPLGGHCFGWQFRVSESRHSDRHQWYRRKEWVDFTGCYEKSDRGESSDHDHLVECSDLDRNRVRLNGYDPQHEIGFAIVQTDRFTFCDQESSEPFDRHQPHRLFRFLRL